MNTYIYAFQMQWCLAIFLFIGLYQHCTMHTPTTTTTSDSPSHSPIWAAYQRQTPSLDMEGRRSRAGERKEEEREVDAMSRVEEREGGMRVRVPEKPPLLRTKSLILMEEGAGGKGEMFFKEKCSNKGELLKHLSKTGFLEPENPAFFHGRIYSRCPPAPIVAWHSSDNPRSFIHATSII